jgi:hypothetical protein
VAELPDPVLTFTGGSPDCGERVVALPDPLPALGDDFDWGARDYDAIRLAMIEELAARSPRRTRWTAADLEVVLVELFAAVADQLSDMLDRVSTEAYLETARRPSSVRRLLSLIGYDAVAKAREAALIAPGDEAAPGWMQLERLWQRRPELMEDARQAGPREILRQRRMATPEDHAARLEEHPLVRRAVAWGDWGGSWPIVRVALIAAGNIQLDATGVDFTEHRARVDAFTAEAGLPAPAWGAATTLRGILDPFVDAYRMAGQEVWVQDAVRVPVLLGLSLRIGADYFSSEVRRAVAEVLGTGPGGFFEPGRLRFGESLDESDLVQALVAVDGVEEVCLNCLKRLGRRHPDESPSGRLALRALEVAACDNDPRHPERGFYRLRLHGGRAG